jgi:hypothetical protein
MTELDTAAAWQLAAQEEDDPRSVVGYHALAELANSVPEAVGLTPEENARLAGRNGLVSPDVSESDNTTLR